MTRPQPKTKRRRRWRQTLLPLLYIYAVGALVWWAASGLLPLALVASLATTPFMLLVLYVIS